MSTAALSCLLVTRSLADSTGSSSSASGSKTGPSSIDMMGLDENLKTCLKDSRIYGPTGVHPLDELRGAVKNHPSDLFHQQFAKIHSSFHNLDLTVDFTTVRVSKPGQRFQAQMTAQYMISTMGESVLPFTQHLRQLVFEVDYDFGVKETFNFVGNEACQDVKIGHRFWHVRKVTLLEK